MSCFIGIDTSTTATKALLMDESGKVLGVASNEYRYETPQPLWSEQAPSLWWHATRESLRQVLARSGVEPDTIRGIGLTGQMHGLTLLDEQGHVLRPAILWNDQRTASQCDEIRRRVGLENLIRITGNDALAGFTAPKILWVQEHEPEIWKRVRHILLPKDYVRYCMTGEFVCDRSDGAGTLLFDLAKRDWSPHLLRVLDIPASHLPRTCEGTELSGRLLPAVADELGLPAGLPVFGGGGDQAASAVGTGAVRAGVVSLSLGTSGVVFATTEGPVFDPQGRLHAFCHSVPARWHLMGVMLSAGGSLRWLRDTFAPGMDYDSLLAPAAGLPAGSEGLFFLPYLTGERTPHPDPHARGAFVGLTVRHGLPHLTRSVLEGVAFGLRDGFELLKGAGLNDLTQVRLTGGGARSPLWRQILADVFSTQIATVNSLEGAAFGAALLAATGAGVFPSVEAACDATIQVTSTLDPGQDQPVYEKAYPVYRSLYPALKPAFAAVS
jgi:xylulokinase